MSMFDAVPSSAKEGVQGVFTQLGSEANRAHMLRQQEIQINAARRAAEAEQKFAASEAAKARKQQGDQFSGELALRQQESANRTRLDEQKLAQDKEFNDRTLRVQAAIAKARSKAAALRQEGLTSLGDKRKPFMEQADRYTSIASDLGAKLAATVNSIENLKAQSGVADSTVKGNLEKLVESKRGEQTAAREVGANLAVMFAKAGPLDWKKQLMESQLAIGSSDNRGAISGALADLLTTSASRKALIENQNLPYAERVAALAANKEEITRQLVKLKDAGLQPHQIQSLLQGFTENQKDVGTKLAFAAQRAQAGTGRGLYDVAVDSIGRMAEVSPPFLPPGTIRSATTAQEVGISNTEASLNEMGDAGKFALEVLKDAQMNGALPGYNISALEKTARYIQSQRAGGATLDDIEKALAKDSLDPGEELLLEGYRSISPETRDLNITLRNLMKTSAEIAADKAYAKQLQATAERNLRFVGEDGAKIVETEADMLESDLFATYLSDIAGGEGDR